jgi:formimidoylglutamate deiminase
MIGLEVPATTGVFSTTIWLRPDAVLTPEGVEEGKAVCLQGGRIVAVADPSQIPAGQDAHTLSGRLLIPGFVNAHSHAFQRTFRGETEYQRGQSQEDDFWMWRDQMYRCAQRLDPEGVHDAALRVYSEMLAAGYTTVGEFHYLHRRPGGQSYDAVEELSQAIIEAATKARIRLVLLEVLYCAGGFDTPLRSEQRRFSSSSFDEYVQLVDAAQRAARIAPLVSVGLAPHSVRAVPVDMLSQVAHLAADRSLVVHMHLSEQPAEVADCLAARECSPVALVSNAGLLGPRFTAVHATHLEPGDVALLADSGSTVCACPSTEANLGDGFLPALELYRAGVPICLGSDSHTLIDPFAEMRMVEYHERLRYGRRNVLTPEHPDKQDRYRVAPGLLAAATAHGATALGIDAGAIRPGAAADLVAVDLHDLALQGVPIQCAPEALALSASPRCVREVWVGGAQVVGDPVAIPLEK